MEKLLLQPTSNPTSVGVGQELIVEDQNGQPLRVLIIDGWRVSHEENNNDMATAEILEGNLIGAKIIIEANREQDTIAVALIQKEED